MYVGHFTNTFTCFMVSCIRRCIACIYESLVYGNTHDIMIIMCHIHLSEMERMQRLAQDNARRIIEETEKLKYELECKKMKLDKWSQQLNEQEVLTISERQKLEEEKKRVISFSLKTL